jgi:hypothetical protein
MADISALTQLDTTNTYEIIANLLGVSVGVAMTILAVISIWALVWKGLALWKAAAKKKSIPWFIVLLVINTMGILEILYIFVFSKIKFGKNKSAKPKKKK